MTFDDRRAAAEELLRACGAYDVHHPGGTLFVHLERVRMLLSEWGASECVQLAGLCHAAYGTDGFGVAPLALHDRPLLVDAIGPEAEDLVYLYARCDREQTYPTLVQPVVVFTDRFSGVDVARHHRALMHSWRLRLRMNSTLSATARR